MAINQISNVIYDGDTTYRNVLREYEEMVLGKRKTYSAASLPKNASPEYCAKILKTILTIYLPKWTPTDIRDGLTPEIATNLYLWPLIKHLPCPEELNPKKDLCFVAWALFPETRNIKEIDLIAGVYQGIINGTRQKFPKGYFYGTNGALRAKAIFKLFMNEFVIPQYNLTCIMDAYDLFASSEIDGLIERCHLMAFVRDRFGLPLNFLHACLGDAADDVMYYNAFFKKTQKGKRSVFLLSSYRVLELNNGVLPKEYEEYLAYQEEQEAKRLKQKEQKKQAAQAKKEKAEKEEDENAED